MGGVSSEAGKNAGGAVSARDELAQTIQDVFDQGLGKYRLPGGREFRAADALIAEGWRKMPGRIELTEWMRLHMLGRCASCSKPVATDEDYETVPEGQGEDLCWDAPGCIQGSDEDRLHVLADAILALMDRGQ